MSLLRRGTAPKGEARSTFNMGQLARVFAGSDNAGGGPSVATIDAALRDAATWACVKVKAQGIAMLPIDVVRYNGGRRLEVSKPQIIAAPSALVSRRVWTMQLATSLFTDGNGFGLITAFDSAMRPTQIELVAPETVTERKVVDGVPQAKVANKVHQLWPFGDLWHMPGEMTLAGSPFALSPITYGSRVTGTSLAAERFGGQFFTDGGHPSAILGLDGDPGFDAAKAIKERLIDMTSGNREPLVIPSGYTYTPLQVNPNDSQFIDLMRFEVEQTCRRHGVPPSMVFAAISGQNVTYANATQADLAYLKHTLSYPVDIIEDALSALLPQPRVVKFNRDAILEGDPMGKVDMHVKRLQSRIATINEVRALDDLDPFPGAEFDEPGIPPMSDSPDGELDDLSPEGGT